jgi:hypothetical protein
MTVWLRFQNSLVKRDLSAQWRASGMAIAGLVITNGIRISMDERGAWPEGDFVARVWKSLKCEEGYVKACAKVPEARTSRGKHLPSHLYSAQPDGAIMSTAPLKVVAAGLFPMLDAVRISSPASGRRRRRPA